MTDTDDEENKISTEATGNSLIHPITQEASGTTVSEVSTDRRTENRSGNTRQERRISYRKIAWFCNSGANKQFNGDIVHTERNNRGFQFYLLLLSFLFFIQLFLQETGASANRYKIKSVNTKILCNKVALQMK
jgi:hypothetical protein